MTATGPTRTLVAVVSVETSQLLLFLVLNAIVFLNAMWLTCLFGGWNTWAERLLDCVLYFVALVVIGFEVLHFARWITLDGLFLFHIAGALVLGLFARRQGREVRGFFSLEPLRGLGWRGYVLLCVIVAWMLAYVYYCRYLPPRSTDALAYHLPLPVQWLKAKELSLVPLFFSASVAAYSPINGELFMAWLIAPFGNDIAVRFVQMPALVAAMLAIYSVLRRWNVSTTLAFACAGLVLIFRPFLREIVMANNDLMLLAAFLGFVSRWQRLDTRWQSWGACGVTLGLLVGTKVVGLVYLAPCLGLVLLRGVELRRHLPPTRLATCGAALLVALIALGSFVYFRNWILTANPLYPAAVNLAGMSLFRGALDSSGMAATHHGLKQAAEFLFLSRGTFGMPTNTTWVWGLGLVGGLVGGCVSAKRRETSRDCLGVLLWLLASYVLFLWQVPFLEERLLFPIYGAGLLLLGRLAGWLGSARIRWLAGAVLGIAAILFALDSVQIRTVVLLTVIVGSSLFLVLRLALRFAGDIAQMRWRVASMSVVIVIGFVCLWQWRLYARTYQTVKYQFYPHVWQGVGPGWIWLNEQTRGGGVIVAYTGSAFVYPLFGQDLQNSLVHVPVEENGRSFLHEYELATPIRVDSFGGVASESLRIARSVPKFESWLPRLVHTGARFLVIYHDPANEPIEASWAEQNPVLFENVFEQGQITIYWLRVSEPPSPAS